MKDDMKEDSISTNSIDAALRETSTAGRLFKPRLEKRDGIDFYFCVRPNTPQRGGRGPGKYHKIVDTFISTDCLTCNKCLYRISFWFDVNLTGHNRSANCMYECGCTYSYNGILSLIWW
jgi:hypothetical protein